LYAEDIMEYIIACTQCCNTPQIYIYCLPIPDLSLTNCPAIASDIQVLVLYQVASQKVEELHYKP